MYMDFGLLEDNKIKFFEYNRWEYTNNGLISKYYTKGNGTGDQFDSFIYDSYGNTTQKVFTAENGESRTQSFTYDDSGRYLVSHTDSEQMTTSYTYDTERGWLLSETNPYGQTTHYEYDGWGRKTKTTDALNKNTYTSVGLPNSQKFINPNNTELLAQTYAFDATKTLLNHRTSSFYGKQENFLYDEMERLTAWGNQNETAQTHTYDNRGRITKNSILGKYNYNGNAYRQASLIIEKNLSEYNPLISVSYTMNKSPHEIYKEGKDRISYQYNAFGGRSIADYGGEGEESTSRTYRHYYSHDGSVEVIQNRKTGNLEFLLYVDGTPYSARAVLQINNQKEQLLFIHRDYLGSIVMLTNAEGDAVEKRHFDAWGNIDKYWNKNGATTIPEGGILLGRGYTGHEHLLSVGLIHMNGRLYDPMLHRFLMSDNYVQDPFNTQNFNRYGYVLNNPLKYTDPSGEIWWLLPAAVFLFTTDVGYEIQKYISPIAFKPIEQI